MAVKAQSSSWNVVIATIIGLVILVISIVLYTGNLGRYSEEANSCENKGGVCANDCGENYAFTPLDCPSEVPKCCLPQREVPDKVFNWGGPIN